MIHYRRICLWIHFERGIHQGKIQRICIRQGNFLLLTNEAACAHRNHIRTRGIKTERKPTLSIRKNGLFTNAHRRCSNWLIDLIYLNTTIHLLLIQNLYHESLAADLLTR